MAGRIILFFLAPLPCFLAGLGWGSASAAISGVAAAIGTGLIVSPKTGVVFLLSQGLPIAVLCHLALLNRPAPAGANGPPGQPALEWYPVGRMVIAAALMAAALSFLSIMLLSPDIDGLRAMMKDLIEKVFLKQIPGFKDQQLGEPEIKALTEMAVHALPAASALSWLAGFLMNLWLAGRITLASGRLQRPWPDVASMTFPSGARLALAAALGLSLLAGYPGLLASGFAGSFLFAFTLMGLAIVHVLTRGRPARTFVLWGLYAALFILNPWVPVLLALLGVLEPMLPWRRSPPPGPPGST